MVRHRTIEIPGFHEDHITSGESGVDTRRSRHRFDALTRQVRLRGEVTDQQVSASLQHPGRFGQRILPLRPAARVVIDPERNDQLEKAIVEIGELVHPADAHAFPGEIRAEDRLDARSGALDHRW